jgi:hypothetical protein
MAAAANRPKEKISIIAAGRKNLPSALTEANTIRRTVMRNNTLQLTQFRRHRTQALMLTVII